MKKSIWIPIIGFLILWSTKMHAQASVREFDEAARTPLEETTMGNYYNYRSQIDLGILPEGELINFTVYSPTPKAYLARYLSMGQSDIFGYLIPENSGITKVSLGNGGYTVTLNTKDHYGDYQEQVDVSTRFGTFYLVIKAKIYDKATLQAMKEKQTSGSLEYETSKHQ